MFPFPIYCNLIITRRCNLRCKSCEAWKHTTPEITTKDMKILLEKLFSIMRPKFIGITGGEPLLRPDVYEIIDFISEKGINVGINSNGTLPAEKYEQLLNTKINTIGISLHFLSPEKQDWFCGVPGSWEKIVNNLKYLRENNKGKFIYVQCTLTSYNYKEVLELKRFVNKELGLPFMIVPATWGPKNGIVRTSNKKISQINTDFERIKKRLKKWMGMRVIRGKTFLEIAFKQFETGKKCWNCRAGEWYFAVSPEGKFCICQDFETDLHILDEDFEEKLKSSDMRRKILETRNKCSGCTYPCYLETQTLLTHPWEAIPLGLSYLYWKIKLLL